MKTLNRIKVIGSKESQEGHVIFKLVADMQNGEQKPFTSSQQTQKEFESRFSALMQMHNILEKMNKDDKLPDFPSRHLFKTPSKELTEQRIKELTQYFNKLTSIRPLGGMASFYNFIETNKAEEVCEDLKVKTKEELKVFYSRSKKVNKNSQIGKIFILTRESNSFILKKDKIGKSASSIQQNIDNMSKLNDLQWSKNIQPPVQCFLESKDNLIKLYTVTLMFETTLEDEIRIRNKQKRQFSKSEIMNILKQVTQGLNTLYSHKTIHGNIKPGNIGVRRTTFNSSSSSKNSTLKQITSNSSVKDDKIESRRTQSKERTFSTQGYQQQVSNSSLKTTSGGSNSSQESSSSNNDKLKQAKDVDAIEYVLIDFNEPHRILKNRLMSSGDISKNEYSINLSYKSGNKLEELLTNKRSQQYYSPMEQQQQGSQNDCYFIEDINEDMYSLGITLVQLCMTINQQDLHGFQSLDCREGLLSTFIQKIQKQYGNDLEEIIHLLLMQNKKQYDDQQQEQNNDIFDILYLKLFGESDNKNFKKKINHNGDYQLKANDKEKCEVAEEVQLEYADECLIVRKDYKNNPQRPTHYILRVILREEQLLDEQVIEIINSIQDASTFKGYCSLDLSSNQFTNEISDCLINLVLKIENIDSISFDFRNNSNISSELIISLIQLGIKLNKSISQLLIDISECAQFTKQCIQSILEALCNCSNITQFSLYLFQQII